MAKKEPLVKAIVWELCWRVFSYVFKFCKIKDYCYENLSFIVYASGIRFSDGCKLAINWKKENDITIFWHDVTFNFIWRCLVFLVKFSYWSKFHVNIVTGSPAMTIFVYKKLTRNPEIGNTPESVLPNI